MLATKTTFYLPNSVRMRMKATAVARGKTVTQLLTEGAELVLAKYHGAADRETLSRRAREAREQLRKGMYSGPAVSGHVDSLLYGKRPPSARRPRRAS